MKSNEDGFTLVELLVVIVILGVLVGIGIPTYNGFIKRSHEAATISELSAVSNAMKYSEIEGIKFTADDTENSIKTLQRYLGDDLTDEDVFLKKYTLVLTKATKESEAFITATPTGDAKKDRLIAEVKKEKVDVIDYVSE